jgi:hypothetical protein
MPGSIYAHQKPWQFLHCLGARLGAQAWVFGAEQSYHRCICKRLKYSRVLTHGVYVLVRVMDIADKTLERLNILHILLCNLLLVTDHKSESEPKKLRRLCLIN